MAEENNPGIDEMALLERLLAEEEGLQLERRETIPRRPPERADLPLSFAQQRLWFLHQLEPESPVYNLPVAVALQGALEVASLEATLGAVTARHEALRTRFPEDPQQPGRPRQVILEGGAPPLPVVDLTGLGEAASVEATALARREARRPFDLARGPLFRTVLLRRTVGAEGEHRALFNLHHIIADGISLPILLRDVAALYTTRAGGGSPSSAPLPELPIQYADFALWQREWLSGAVLEDQLTYWRGQLRGLGGMETVELPADHPRPPVRGSRGARRSGALSPGATTALEGLAQGAGGSVFAVLTALVHTLLYRYSGSGALTVGTVVANRRRRELEDLIGFFVNTLVLRGDLRDDPPFRELVARTGEVVVEAQGHQDVPFELLVEALAPERDLSRTPLFQVMLAYDVAADATGTRAGIAADDAVGSLAGTVELPGLTLTPLPERGETAKFDLVLHAHRGVSRSGRTILEAEFSTELFEASTIDRLLGHLATLAEGIAAAPETRLSRLPLLTPAEVEQLAALTPAATVFPLEATGEMLPHRFAAHAARHPEAPALRWEGRTVTYGTLRRRAAAVAERLRALGVGPESRVALLCERGEGLVAAILGTLEAGAAYVPVDPEYPAERRRFLLTDCGATVVLVSPGIEAADALEGVPGVPGITVVVLDDAEADPAALPPLPTIHPHQAAYIIYTSGSTGQPKGVVVSHGNAARLLRAAEAHFDFHQRPGKDVWTLFHSYAFDFSVWELWGALAHGGTLVVVPYWVSRSPEDFRALLAQEGVTVLNQTPSAFRNLMRADGEVPDGSESVALALRWVIFGGEALEPRALAPWVERHGLGQDESGQDDAPRLVNMYGITETTVHVTFRELDRDAIAGGRSVIGAPLADLELHVLDRWGSPAPLGVPGELHVGGAALSGLSRGYLGRPALTAERFVPHAGGTRLYRSGDLARRVVLREGGDGTPVDLDIEYLGRIDHQVQLRGFRVELGEVEAALLAHPAIAEAVVVVQAAAAGDRLVAYLVAGSGEVPGGEALRRHLAERLPEYMIPAFFVPLEALPLTVHGKVDRGALPEPEGVAVEASGAAAGATPYAPPQGTTEAVLAAVWQNVLGVERVGRHDPYFALGGDSMRAVEVVAQARQRGVAVRIQDLFQHPTIAELAASAGETGEASKTGATGATGETGESEPFVVLSAADRARLPEDAVDAYPLTVLQAGMLFHMQTGEAYPLYHNVDSAHLEHRHGRAFDPQAFQDAVDAVVRRHPILRTSFHMTGYDEPLQVVHREARLEVTVESIADLDGAAQQEAIESYMDAQARRPFDLTAAPQLGLHVHRRGMGPKGDERDEGGGERFQLTVTENHAIFDGWSLHATLNEIFAGYFARLRGETVPVAPPVPALFRDYVLLERRSLEDPASRAYWHGVVEGTECLTLSRHSRRAAIARTRRTRERHLSKSVGEGLERLARAAGVPLKSVLLAAHGKALAALTGADDLVTGMQIHGRPEVEGGEDIRGLFLNVVPCRLRPAAGSWGALARHALAVEQGLLPHRHYPMARLVQELGGRPLFETMFNYVHFHVIEGLRDSGEVTLLGFEASEMNSYTLCVTVAASPYAEGSPLTLISQSDAAEIGEGYAERIEAVYLRVLEAMATAGAEGLHHQLDLLSAAERRQLVGNATPPGFPVPRSLPERFLEQVARDPEAVAMTVPQDNSPAVTLTYGALEAASRRLAEALRRRGVGLEERVALATGRDAGLVVALLGIVRAGGAYVPLDPAYPAERRRMMLEDSGARWVVTDDAALLAGVVPEGVEIVSLEAALDAAPEAAPAAGDLPHLPPEAAAYVIYTSGSTGQPKGVVVSHGNAARLFDATAGFGFGAADVWTLFHAYAFDFSVWELWGALAHGGRLVVVPHGVSRSPEAFHRLLIDEGVTVLNQTPSAFRGLVAADGAAADTESLALRWVIFGGEALDLAPVRAWFERHGDGSAMDRDGGPERRRGPWLVNMYGITETTVHVTERVLTAADPERWEAAPGSPIGHPIEDLSLHVLDRWGMPLPDGAVGELYVGGAALSGLSRGYLGRPALTAERFVPDPFSGHPGARLYRSGDRGRRRPHPGGEVEHLGRIDQQVQLRGFRIEPGEIEAALETHPAVTHAVVAVHAHPGQEDRLVAWVVPASPPETPDELPIELRRHLESLLPAHMVPNAFVLMERLPLTANGKLDRGALPTPDRAAVVGKAEYRPPSTEAQQKVARLWRQALGVEKVGLRDNFFDLGGHSLHLVRLKTQLEEAFGREVPMVDLFRYPTLEGLARFLDPNAVAVAVAGPSRQRRRALRRSADESTAVREIAIVGMAGRFPTAQASAEGDPEDGLDTFWRQLRDGVEAIRFFSDEELRAAGIREARLQDPRFVKAAAILDAVDHFDATLFRMSPREAQIIDPQQRLFLEQAWAALEDAGCDPERFAGEIGVFAGVGLNSYGLGLMTDPGLVATVGQLNLVLANADDYLPTRVAYKLDLRGPAVNVQTACSTSLVAVHQACRALVAGECDAALAGGVSLSAFGPGGYDFVEGGIVSPDGHCRAFDQHAGGSVSGSAVGVVVLKRLEDALADGDTVRAVILGSAINNDGAERVGFTAPSVEGQSRVLAAAREAAGITGTGVQYIETHGTATPLGDPIEVAALARAYGPSDPAATPEPILLGSVKTNIGHTDAAAGVSGLLKTVLALQHGEVPPSLYFDQPNPTIPELAPGGAFRVAGERTPWPTPPVGEPRRAAVSSFGLGGTNAHVILEEAPAPAPSSPSRPGQLLVLSAATADAADAAVARLGVYLQQRLQQRLEGEGIPWEGLADIAFTLQMGRRRLDHRRALLVSPVDGGGAGGVAVAAEALVQGDPTRLLQGTDERRDRPVAFLLPGVGDQHPGMARQLYATEPTFRDEIDACAAVLEPALGLDLRTLLFPEEGEAGAEAPPVMDLKALLRRGGGAAQQRDDRLDRTLYAQTSVLVVELALARLWAEWGIEPTAMIGYSLGEYTAACLAGVLTRDDALGLVAERAKLIEELPAGGMVAVPLPVAEVEARLEEHPELSLAAANAPSVTVVAGPEAALEPFEAALTAEGLVLQRLATRHAFHSAMMEPIVERFVEIVGKVALTPPRVPFLSNVTGRWITPEEATDPAYWGRHLRGTVRFAEGLATLLAEEEPILLEVGPGQALATSARQHPACGPERPVIGGLPGAFDRRPAVPAALDALARLWLAGAPIDWQGFARHEQRRRVPLPTYPFDRRRYWIEATAAARGTTAGAGAALARGESGEDPKQPDIARWFHAPCWKPSSVAALPPLPPLPPLNAKGEEGGAGPVLVLAPKVSALADAVLARLEAAGEVVTGVRVGADSELADPADSSAYATLIEGFVERHGAAPRTVLHLLSVGAEETEGTEETGAGAETATEAERARQVEWGFHSLLALAQALAPVLMAGDGDGDPAADQDGLREAQILAVTTGVHGVTGDEPRSPEKATVLGPARVFAQEYGFLRCRHIDLDARELEPDRERLSRLADALVAEAAVAEDTLTVAYRRGRRWSRGFEPFPLPERSQPAPRLRPGGHYLVAGGFGGMGLELARAVLEGCGGAARFTLLGRREPDAAAREALAALEAAGAEILPQVADLADGAAVAAAVAAGRQRFGAVHGVIHAAGVPGIGLAQLKTRAAADAVLAAKVAGLRHLEAALPAVAEGADAAQEPPFFVLCSAAASILGGLGQVDYCAANAFLDAWATAYTESPTSSGERFAVALDWGLWAETGMALRPEVRELQGDEYQENLRHGILPAEGAEAFHRALGGDAPQLVVWQRDWATALEHARLVRAAGVAAARRLPMGERHPRPDLPTPFVAPETETQTALAALWGDLLGIDAVGIHDDFFQLGGDSLLAVQMLSRVRGRFHTQLAIGDLFNGATIAVMATTIDGGGPSGDEEQTRLEDLFQSIEALTEEEAVEAVDQERKEEMS
jgi:amino acid adenylation domain-containing protein